MERLILFILISYGISNIIIFGSIFQSMRDRFLKFSPKLLGKLVSCMICLGTWVGFTLSIYSHCCNQGLSPTSSLISNPFISIFLDGCLSSGCCWLIHTVQEAIERTNNY